MIWPYLVLSESIDYAPSSCIGSFLLSPACAMLAIVALLRKEQLAPVTPSQPFWSLGAFGALGGHGVASFQVHNAPAAHFTFAALFFVATTLYVMLSVRHELVHAAPMRSPLCARIRLATGLLAPALIVCAVALVPFLAAAIESGEAVDFDDTDSASTGSRVGVLVMLLAALEVSVYLNFAAHFASLLPELRGVEVGFNMTRTAVLVGYPIGDGTLDQPFINYVADVGGSG
jgi:hypothetical protein